jgi:hypothetical protein
MLQNVAHVFCVRVQTLAKGDNVNVNVNVNVVY